VAVLLESVKVARSGSLAAVLGCRCLGRFSCSAAVVVLCGFLLRPNCRRLIRLAQDRVAGEGFGFLRGSRKVPRNLAKLLSPAPRNCRQFHSKSLLLEWLGLGVVDLY
jgi:hypothetical protein